MHIELNDDMLHPKLGENGLELFCYLSDAIDETLDAAMAAWGNGNEEVTISMRFALSDALNSAINLHEMPAYDNAIDVDAEPMFNAMRAELVTMIERIDALKFGAPESTPDPVAQSDKYTRRLKMVTPEDEIVKRFDSFADTRVLGQWLYDIAHDDGEANLTAAQKYIIMEARDNLFGLYDLCWSFVIAQVGREHKAKHGYNPVGDND